MNLMNLNPFDGLSDAGRGLQLNGPEASSSTFELGFWPAFGEGQMGEQAKHAAWRFSAEQLPSFKPGAQALGELGVEAGM